MKYALNLAEDNRILSVTFKEYASEDAVLVDELPAGDVSDYKYENEEYIYEPIEKPNYDAVEQIAALKKQLASTDYKIIKCSEAQLVGEELPYDITALHAERQAIRNQINELEGSES